MKKLIFILIAAVTMASCNSSGNGSNVYVQAEAENLGDNLNLQALGELVKSSTSAEDIETKLNAPNSINNLDLDGDGQVDYIKVTEYNNGNTRGFSFTVDLADSSQQEIASVEVEPNGDSATMSIAGNETIYGSGYYYQSHYTMADFMLWHYLMTPHVVYMSPYRYGYYPSYYHPYARVTTSSYGNRVSSTTKTTTITKTTTTRASSSPNKSLTSSKVTTRAKSLSNPTQSQRSFKQNTGSKTPNTNGFKSGSSSDSKKTVKPSNSGFKSTPSRSSGRSSGFGSSSRSSGSRRR